MARLSPSMVLVLLLAFTASPRAAPLGGADPTLPDPGLPGARLFDPDRVLDFGFGLQLNRPYQAPGGRAKATLFFYNMTPYDADGALANPGGLGCRYHLFVRDGKGRTVWRPPPCLIAGPDGQAAPAGPFPFPGGSFLQYPVELSLVYERSDTADPDGEPLPGGPYLLEGRHDYGGPVIPEPGVWAAGGRPRAEVPFRIALCDGAGGPMEVRELGRGLVSGYRYMEPDFWGEDLVLRTEEAGMRFWFEHIGFPIPPDDAQEPPDVDFGEEMVLVSVLGERGSGVRIVSVEEGPCHILVQVEEEIIPWDGPLRVNPFCAVAVPRSLKEVVFVHRARQ